VPAPLDPAVREAIEAAIREGEGARAIARAHGVAQSTVSRIGRQLEKNGTLESPAFDRSKAKCATAARVADLADLHASEAVEAYDAAVTVRGMFFAERPVMVGKGDDAVVLNLPPAARDLKDLAIAYGILLDKSRQLVSVDDPADQGKAAVLTLVDELRANRAARAVS
jgi:transposase-like protein